MLLYISLERFIRVIFPFAPLSISPHGSFRPAERLSRSVARLVRQCHRPSRPVVRIAPASITSSAGPFPPRCIHEHGPVPVVWLMDDHCQSHTEMRSPRDLPPLHRIKVAQSRKWAEGGGKKLLTCCSLEIHPPSPRSVSWCPVSKKVGVQVQMVGFKGK